MNVLKSVLIALTAVAFVSVGCNNSDQEEAHNPNEINMGEGNQEAQPEEKEELPGDFLGVYQGVQESYYMKNQYGDDMIVAGKRILVPASDLKFLLKENNAASLQHTNSQNGERQYYDGTYELISHDENTIVAVVSLSDGEGSSPTYTLVLNKSDKTGTCDHDGSPRFNISIVYPPTTILFSEYYFDFGTMDEGDLAEHIFKFTNTGSGPLVIESCKGSCGCLVPTCTKEPIQPGEEGEIKVKFNSRGKKNKQTKRVTITANTAPEAQTVLTITANVTPAPEQGK